jgi:lysophospholipase L1-like esterase
VLANNPAPPFVSGTGEDGVGYRNSSPLPIRRWGIRALRYVGRVALPWSRFVALGDSLTEGVGDLRSDGSLRGWADRLAEAMGAVEEGFQYTNLARRGLRTDEVLRQQLHVAVRLRPDLSSALMGMNDLLEPDFRPARYGSQLGEIVGALREGGSVVLMATFPDVTAFSPLPARFLAGIRARLRAASDVVRDVADRHDALCLDLEAQPEARQRDVMSIDRLHPGPRGHLLLAQAFARLLEEHSGVPVPQPEEGEIAGRLAQARWLVRQFRPTEVARFVYRFYLAPRRSIRQ